MEQESGLKDRVQKQFGRTAEEYVTSESHAKGEDLSLLVDWLSPKQTWIALDVATGGGHVARAVSPWVRTVFAVDLTQTMLEAARHHLMGEGVRNVHFVLADAESLPFLDETFDAVICRIAAHHFPQPEKFVQESWRVLKPGGSWLMIDNVAPDDSELATYMNTFEKMRDESHVQCPSIREWESWIKATGFHLKNSRIRQKEYPFASWVRRMVQSEEQVQRVEAYILSARPTVQEYFGIHMQNGHLESLHVDEWMVLCTKPM